MPFANFFTTPDALPRFTFYRFFLAVIRTYGIIGGVRHGVTVKRRIRQGGAQRRSGGAPEPQATQKWLVRHGFRDGGRMAD